MRLYLLRHGETDWNVVRRLQGSVDTSLNANGVRQAEQWRSYFDGLRLAGIYSSSRQRALHTAALATGRPACIISDFDERGFGVWEGCTWDELSKTVGEFDERWNEDSFCPPGGESRQGLYDRVLTGLQCSVLEHRASDEILVVAHGASGHAIMINLLGQAIEARHSLPPLRNASLTILESHGPRWSLVGQPQVSERC